MNLKTRLAKLEQRQAPRHCRLVRIIVQPGETIERVIARDFPDHPQILDEARGEALGAVRIVARMIVAAGGRVAA